MSNPEASVAARVVDWLSSEGWDVYTEVTRGGPRADIVATRGPLVWVIEVKAKWSFALLEQAAYWVGRAHLVSIACSPVRMGEFRIKVMRWQGIGALLVNQKVCQEVAPSILRTADVSGFRKVLAEPALKAWGAAPGNNYSDFWSPYKQTCREVLRRVTEQPGVKTRELIDGLRHHYQTDAAARATLRQWARHDKVPGVEFKDGRWWPKGYVAVEASE